jgi:dTDP-4-dehydrorhamnose 3,5-epimerase
MNSKVLRHVIGNSLPTAQMNTSVSRRGVLRGVHFALTPPGQAKHVTATAGSVLDFVIDVRVGSPTFGEWEAVELTADRHNSVYLSAGLGHAFIALSEQATVCYLVSAHHDPAREFAINPLDPQIKLELPFNNEELILSARDRTAPSLAKMQSLRLLPAWGGHDEKGRPSTTQEAGFE